MCYKTTIQLILLLIYNIWGTFLCYMKFLQISESFLVTKTDRLAFPREINLIYLFFNACGNRQAWQIRLWLLRLYRTHACVTRNIIPLMVTRISHASHACKSYIYLILIPRTSTRISSWRRRALSRRREAFRGTRGEKRYLEFPNVSRVLFCTPTSSTKIAKTTTTTRRRRRRLRRPLRSFAAYSRR